MINFYISKSLTKKWKTKAAFFLSADCNCEELFVLIGWTAFLSAFKSFSGDFNTIVPKIEAKNNIGLDEKNFLTLKIT